MLEAKLLVLVTTEDAVASSIKMCFTRVRRYGTIDDIGHLCGGEG